MEFFLLPDGKSAFNILGGPALHAAAGAGLWSPEGVGLISRVGKNFSPDVLRKIGQSGLNTAGIRIFPDLPPSLGFHYFESWERDIDWDPAKYFARNNIPFPRELMDYSPPSLGESSIQHFPDIAIRIDDIPAEYREARAVYIAPCHYQSQITLSVALRQCGVGTILLSPPEGLLLPSYRSQIREILHGIDILYAREASMQAFVGGPDPSPEKISAYLAQWGPKIVILQKDLQGVHIFDADTRKIRYIPFYPVELENPLAVGDSFCGGFLASWRKTYNPEESALVGCVSASLAMEGLEGLYALQRNPGLAEARLASLRRSAASQ
jgi:sugar/nucleoside kinase (ribokinase family)